MGLDVYGNALEDTLERLGGNVARGVALATYGVTSSSAIAVKEISQKMKAFVEKCILNMNAISPQTDSENDNVVVFFLKGDQDNTNTQGDQDNTNTQRQETASQVMPPDTGLEEPVSEQIQQPVPGPIQSVTTDATNVGAAVSTQQDTTEAPEYTCRRKSAAVLKNHIR